MTVPAEALAVGVPAVIKEGRSSVVFNQGAAALYVANGKRYKATLVRLDRLSGHRRPTQSPSSHDVG